MKFSEIEEGERTTFLDNKVKTETLHPGRIRTVITVCNAIFFIVSISLFSKWYHETRIKSNAHLRQVSSYSPLLDAVNLPMHLTKLNATLYPPKKNPSLARQKPSPEVDAIWDEWELTRVYPVSSAQIRAMGKDPSTVMKLKNDIWGLGDDAYASIFDVYHQVHCLNMFRKLVYPDYYKSHGWKHSADPKAMFEIHMEHCVDILLQALQCSGNLNLITLHWVEMEPFPFPDASINRKCVDFSSLTQWRLDNTIDIEKFNQTMDKPPGVKQLKAPDGYYKYFRPDKVNPNHANGANPDVDFNL